MQARVSFAPAQDVLRTDCDGAKERSGYPLLGDAVRVNKVMLLSVGPVFSESSIDIFALEEPQVVARARPEVVFERRASPNERFSRRATPANNADHCLPWRDPEWPARQVRKQLA